MPSSEPDSATIDAWLAGELSDEEVAAIEAYFDEHPESLPDAGELPDDEMLEELATESPDDELTDLIGRIKTSGPESESTRSASGENWREVLTPSDDPDLLGTIGDYEVLELIAIGGMGIVLKARDPELDRLAAVKVLAPDLAANATARERFLREARAAAKLEHENILPIYGVHDDGVPYFAMRHAPGGTLQDRLDAGDKFGIDQLKSIARQVASALSAAHERGIVHRDIKPANILFDGEGDQLWVCDFGIARSTEDPSLTYPGAIAGTPQFMSPEQAAGDELDGRSDLFALGAVLHCCATGTHAVSGETTAAVLGQLGSNQPTTIAPPKEKLPTWFRRLLINLLAKDPRDRPRNAEAVIRAIDDEHSPRPKHTARRNKRLAVTAISLAVISGLSFGLLQVPVVKSSVNRLLSLRHEQAFTIASRLGAHSSLARAIAAARDGDTIELPVGNPIAVDNLQLPPGKALTLTSSHPGMRPVFTTAIAGAPGIISRSPLRLTGIDFQLNPKRDSDGIVVADGAELEIVDCQFVARRVVANPFDDVKARAIELRGEVSAEIRDCDFDLEETNAITIRGGSGTVRIRDSRVAAFYAVNLLEYESEGERIAIDAADSQFTGQRFLKGHSGGGSIPVLNCQIANCKFVTARSLCWFHSHAVETVRERLQWNGQGNSHILGNDLVQIGPNSALRDAVALMPISFYSDQPVAPEASGIEIAETGERFTDFKAAFDRAPEVATLLLSGRIVCHEEVLAPSGKSFHLRAAPGSDPEVVAVHSTGHALFFFGKTTISGIRFSRPDAAPNGMPTIGIGAGGKEVLIEDCQFDAGPTIPDDSNIGIGLGLTDIGTATVRRSVFRCGRGVFSAFVESPPRPATIQFDECLFAGQSAMQVSFRVADSQMTIDASRCVFVGDFLLTTHPQHPLRSLEVEFTECLLDPRKGLMRFPIASLDSVEANVRWAGRDNFYRADAGGLSLPQKSRESAADQSTELDNLEAFLTSFPGADDSGGRFGEPFDRSRLQPPLTPAALLETLNPEIDSPAIETLRLLAEKGESKAP